MAKKSETKRDVVDLVAEAGATLDKIAPNSPTLTKEQRYELSKLDHEWRRTKQLYVFGTAVVVSVTLFGVCWLSLHYGRADLALDLVKVLVGFAGGYAVKAAIRK